MREPQPEALYGKMPDAVELELQPMWFDLMLPDETNLGNAAKTVEGRVDPAKYEGLLAAGDDLFLTCGGIYHRVQVVGTRTYPTLEEYLAAEWQQAAPQAASLDEAREIYARVWMTSKSLEKDGAPAGEETRVFGEARVRARGGIIAIEVRERPPAEH